MADIKVLMVVNDAEAGKAYAKALSEIGVAYEIAPSIIKMAGMATESAYNGLIIDIFTLVRCSKEEKAIAYDCINLFPVLRVKWDKKQKQINLIPTEQTFSSNADSALKHFIEKKCKDFPPRQLRRHKRRQLNLNLLLSQDESFLPHNTSKAFTVTVSMGGAFVHSMQTFPEGQQLWLRFPEFADQTPIPVTVKWALEWGVSRSIPGIGVKFERLSEDQERELEKFLNC